MPLSPEIPAFEFHQRGIAGPAAIIAAAAGDFITSAEAQIEALCAPSCTHNGKTNQLMSVHLKSGCFENSITSSACTKLKQVPILENWMDTAANGPVPFIVLGDFNRRFNLPGDTVWAELDDANPPNADLETITKDMPVSCRDNQFTSFIDLIVFDKRAWVWADRSSFRQITYRQEDKEKWNKLSDHCPVMVELWIK
jgi:endonuclease/exonuclease/phosphatase family metal-dependent hydrolase